jgi:hypothetical protein
VPVKQRSATATRAARRPTFDLTFRPRTYRWPRRPRTDTAATATEVTIARISLATPHRDVISLRARPGSDGRIRYRMIHDDVHGPANRRIRMSRAASDKPLAMGELVELLDTAYYDGACADPRDQECFGRVIWGTLRLHFEHGIEHADAYLFFTTVTSERYPQLEAYYRERMSEWCIDNCEEAEDCKKVVRLRRRRG